MISAEIWPLGEVTVLEGATILLLLLSPSGWVAVTDLDLIPPGVAEEKYEELNIPRGVSVLSELPC